MTSTTITDLIQTISNIFDQTSISNEFDSSFCQIIEEKFATKLNNEKLINFKRHFLFHFLKSSYKIIDPQFACSFLSTFDESIDKVFQNIIENFISTNYVEICNERTSIQNQNILILISVIFDNYFKLQYADSIDLIFEYIATIIEFENDLNTIVWAIICLEKSIEVKKNVEVSNQKLIPNLGRHSQNMEFCLLSQELRKRLIRCLNQWQTLDKFNISSDRYKVIFCAKWCVNNVLLSANQLEPIESVKFGGDQLSFRCDRWPLCTTQSSFSIESGTYFYEVVLSSNGLFCFGWCSHECKSFGLTKCVGDDLYSIGFGGMGRQSIRWNGRSTYQAGNSSLSNWKQGDVVGCFADFDQLNFVFYLNGYPISFQSKIEPKWNGPFHATITAGVHQQCQLNFGQRPFRYPPNTNFVILSENTNSTHSTFCLLKCEFDPISEMFWYKNFYTPKDDKKQNQFNEWIGDLEMLLLNDHSNISLITDRLKLLHDNNLDDFMLRLICAFINVGGTVMKNEIQIANLMSSFMDQLSLLGIDQVKPTMSNLLSLIYSYMYLSSQDVRIRRNLCLIISCIANTDYGENRQKIIIYNEVADFLCKILLSEQTRMKRMSNMEKSSQLFAIIAMESLAIDPIVWKRLKLRQPSINTILYSEALKCHQTYDLNNDQFELQISFCCKWFLDNILVGCVAPDTKIYEKKAKILANEMSVRNDHVWTGIRSETPLTSGTYFYEVIITTDGEMVHGWTRNESISNKCNYIIGYDGNRRWIVHGHRKIPVVDPNVKRWKSGDVIGCLLNIESGQFTFYYNGKKLETEIIEKNHSFVPYYAASTVSKHQQFRYNTGECRFKYPPDDIQFLTLKFVAESKMEKDTKMCHIL